MLYSPIATSVCILFWVVLNQSEFLTFTRRPHETIHSGIIYRPPDNYLNGSAAAVFCVHSLLVYCPFPVIYYELDDNSEGFLGTFNIVFYRQFNCLLPPHISSCGSKSQSQQKSLVLGWLGAYSPFTRPI